MANVEVFKHNLIDAGIVDPNGVHHEFVSGLHGQKIDFDSVPDESDLFQEWVAVFGDAIDLRYPAQDYPKIVVMSVANGTNRVVDPIAERLGPRATAIQTVKVSAKAVELTPEAIEKLLRADPDMVVAAEDVGTKGTTSASAVVSARKVWNGPIEAMNTWQRRPELEELIGIGATYSSIIFEPMPSLTPEQCLSTGFCAQGWQFIEHAK